MAYNFNIDLLLLFACWVISFACLMAGFNTNHQLCREKASTLAPKSISTKIPTGMIRPGHLS